MLISGDLFLSRAVLPGLAAALGVPDSSPAFSFDSATHSIVLTGPRKLAGDGDIALLSYAMSIVADKLVATAQLRRTSSEGIEQKFTVRCSHSARFDAASRTLLFVVEDTSREDTNPSEPAVDRAVRALASAIAAASTKSITQVQLSRDPEPSVASPVTATFHIHTAALAGAVCLQGNWS